LACVHSRPSSVPSKPCSKEHGLGEQASGFYQLIKIGEKWVLCPVGEDASDFSDGPFYVSWYQGKEKQMDPVGCDPEHALSMAKLKRAELAYVSAGGGLGVWAGAEDGQHLSFYHSLTIAKTGARITVPKVVLHLARIGVSYES
jgi:hypothetical protein